MRRVAFVLAVVCAFASVGAPAIAAAPTITVQPTIEAAPTGADVDLSVVATPSDGGSLSYQWFYELLKGSGVWLPAAPAADLLGVGYSGANTDTLRLKGVTSLLNNLGLKVVVTSSSGGSVSSDEVSPVVGDPPLLGVVAQVESRVVTGGTTRLSAVAPVGMAPVAYSWQVLRPGARWSSLTNGTGVSGVRTPTLTLSNLTTDVAKNSYRLVATNAVGVDICDPLKIDVGVRPTVSTPADQTATNGAVTLTSTVAGNPVPTVRWQRRSTPSDSWVDVSSDVVSLVNGAATAKLSKLTTADNGAQFRVVASNPFGESAQSDPATITVAGSKPTITDPVERFSLGTGVGLSVNVTGDPAPVVTWQRRAPGTGAAWEDLAGVGSVSAGVATLPFSALTSALGGYRFRAVARNAVDTVVSDSSQLIAGVLPTVTNPVDKTAAAGSASFSVNVTGEPAPTVTWQRRTGGSQWEDLTGQGTVSAGVATLPLTSVTSALNGSRYRAVVKNTVGQVVSDSAQLIAGTVADVSNPTAQTSLLGAATFTASVSGDPMPTTRWQVLDTSAGARWTNVSGGSQVGSLASLTLTGLTKAQSGNRYRVVATNGVDTPAVSDSALLTVPSSALSITNPASAVTSPLNGSVTLSVAASGDPTPTIQWQSLAPGGSWTNLVNGVGVAGATTSQLTLSLLSALRNGYRYRAVATNGNETATSAASLLTVNVT